MAAGVAGFVPAHTAREALLPAIVFGAAGGFTWSGLMAMLAEVAPQSQYSNVYGVSYALANAGLGLGALVGGFVVAGGSARSFAVVFVADAATNLIFATVLAAMRDEARRPRERRQPGYRAVLGDRGLLALVALNTLLVTVGTSQLVSAFPAWTTGPAGLSARVVGIAFVANTITVVAGQLVTLRLIRAWRHTRATALGAGIFAGAWLVVLLAGSVGTAVAATCLVGALAVFAVGETLVAPSLPAIVNDLAPDELRGRYNAVFTLSWQLGPVIGPALAGVALGRGAGGTFFAALAAACLLAAAFSLRLERVVAPARL
jgi:MFS family permease